MPGFGQLLKTAAGRLAPKHPTRKVSWKPACTNHSRTEYMVCQVVFRNIVLPILFAGLCSGKSLTLDEADNQYLTVTRNLHPGCSDGVFAVQIDASLPDLKKQEYEWAESGFSNREDCVQWSPIHGRQSREDGRDRRLSGKRCEAGERVVGTDVIRENYSFAYIRTSEYKGLVAYVFRLTPCGTAQGFSGASCGSTVSQQRPKLAVALPALESMGPDSERS
jgi:hypothetical protein